MRYDDTGDIWRLYTREWVVVHTITMHAVDPRPVFDACQAWVLDNLDGRVRLQDVRCTLNTDTGSTFWGHIEVFKDNLKGEFKHFGAADLFAHTRKFEEYTIVPRNSAADHDIRNYGVRKL